MNETEIAKTEEEFVLDKTIKVGKWRIPVGHVKSDETPDEGADDADERKGKIKKTLKKVGKIAVPIVTVGGAVVGAIALFGGKSDGDYDYEMDDVSGTDDDMNEVDAKVKDNVD